MGNVISFKDKKSKPPLGIPVIEKLIDGKIVEYVNLDEMSAAQRIAWEAWVLSRPEPPAQPGPAKGK